MLPLAVLDPGPEVTGEVTVDWVKHVLRRAGVMPGSDIVSVEKESLGAGAGSWGELWRLRLHYGAGAARGPASVVLKLGTRVPANLALPRLLGLYERESRFYAEVAPQGTIRTPACYWNRYEATSQRCGLLLEDLSHLRAVDELEGLGVEDALAIVDQLGRFHAARWQHPQLDRFDWAQALNGPANSLAAGFYREYWPQFVAGYQDELPPSAIKLGALVRDRFPEVLDRLAEPPATLVHGDVRPNNLFFPPAGESGDVVFADWQLVGRGRAAFDVASLLSRAMTVEDRRRYEAAIVRRWHQSLVSAGVPDYRAETAFDDYRLGILFFYVFAVRGVGVERANERAVAFAHAEAKRIFTAGLDLDLGLLLA